MTIEPLAELDELAGLDELPRTLTRLDGLDIAHRMEFVTYATEDGLRRDIMNRLYTRWLEFNRDYWGDRMTEPPILIAEPSRPQRLGDCSTVSGWGSPLQIRLRPSLISGEHPLYREGSGSSEGQARFVEDVLLHEMIHQAQYELLGVDEDSYHGHGPIFRDECNRIGALMGLPRVRTMKKRGRDRDLPSCAQWPWCVRPADYYLGAIRHAPADEIDLEGIARRLVLRLGRERSAELVAILERSLAPSPASVPRTGDTPLAAPGGTHGQ